MLGVFRRVPAADLPFRGCLDVEMQPDEGMGILEGGAEMGEIRLNGTGPEAGCIKNEGYVSLPFIVPSEGHVWMRICDSSRAGLKKEIIPVHYTRTPFQDLLDVAKEPAGSEVYAHFPENELPSEDKTNSTGPPVPSFSFQVPVSVLPAAVPETLPFVYFPVTDEPVWVMVISSPVIPVAAFPEPHDVFQVPAHEIF